MSFNCIFNSSRKTFNVFTVSSMKLITLIISTFFDDLRYFCGSHIVVFWWPPMLLWRPSPSFLMNSDVVVEAISSFLMTSDIVVEAMSSFFDDLRCCCGGHLLVFWMLYWDVLRCLIIWLLPYSLLTELFLRNCTPCFNYMGI